jgi:hypothetical protein
LITEIFFSIFPAVAEIQAIMKLYNVGTEKAKLVDYEAFVKGLRLPLKDRRLLIVKEAFAKICGDEGAACITIAQAKASFMYEEFE